MFFTNHVLQFKCQFNCYIEWWNINSYKLPYFGIAVVYWVYINSMWPVLAAQHKYKNSDTMKVLQVVWKLLNLRCPIHTPFCVLSLYIKVTPSKHMCNPKFLPAIDTKPKNSMMTIQPVTCNCDILVSQIISHKAITWTVLITTRIWTQKYTPKNVCRTCSFQNMQYIYHADSCFSPSTWKPCHFPVSVNSKLLSVS